MALIVGAATVASAAAASAAQVPSRTIRIQACNGPTMAGPYVYNGPSRTRVHLGDVAARRLVSFDGLLLAPRGWRCHLTSASDGVTLIAYNPSAGFFATFDNPPRFEPEEAVMAYYATSGPHAAELACPLFPAASSYMPNPGTACGPASFPAPSRESRSRVGLDEVRFVDPPGVDGTGVPSGGRNTALGVVLFERKRVASTKTFTDLAATATCTVPKDLRFLCAPILSNVIEMAGIRPP